MVGEVGGVWGGGVGGMYGPDLLFIRWIHTKQSKKCSEVLMYKNADPITNDNSY